MTSPADKADQDGVTPGPGAPDRKRAACAWARTQACPKGRSDNHHSSQGDRSQTANKTHVPQRENGPKACANHPVE